MTEFSRRDFLRTAAAGAAIVAALPLATAADASACVVDPAPNLPIGRILMLGEPSKTPPGWMDCDGRAVPVAEYRRLFESIGRFYGGTERDFNLPDMRGHSINGPKVFFADRDHRGNTQAHAHEVPATPVRWIIHAGR